MSEGTIVKQSSAPSRPAGPGARLVQELAVRVLEGDDSAHTELYRRLVGPIHGLFLKHVGGDTHTAELLAHEAVSEALLRLTDGRYVPDKAWFLTFVYGVAHKVKLRYFKERRRSKGRPLSEFAETQEGENECIRTKQDFVLPFDQVEAMWGCLFDADASGSLTAEERFVVIGRANDKTFETLARELGRSLDTIYRRQMSALAKLRESMERKGFS